MSARVQLQHEWYRRLLDSQYAPPSMRLVSIRQNIERLVRHAHEFVPFYEHRLAPLFSSNGLSWDRWSEVPILRREDLLSRRDSMQSTRLPKYQGAVLEETTTGSTGAPVTVTHSTYSGDVLAAVIYRGRTWHNLDWGGDILSWAEDKKLDVATAREQMGPAWGPPWLAESIGRSWRVTRMADAGAVLEAIARVRPRYLSCRPTSAQYLALEATRLGMHIHVDAILAYSTAVSAQERYDCWNAFGAKVIGQYASKEGHNIAYQCPEGDHYHVNDEAVLVELLDDNDQPVVPGQVGRVVITNIHNLAQPIIRYEQGDIALWGEQCSCGRTLSVLQRIVGRTTNLFRFPDGRVVAPIIPDALRTLLNAQIWQIAQISPLQIEVRYVPFPGSSPTPGSLEVVRSMIRDRTHPQASVSVVAVSDIRRSIGGKYVEVVSEVPQPDP